MSIKQHLFWKVSGILFILILTLIPYTVLSTATSATSGNLQTMFETLRMKIEDEEWLVTLSLYKAVNSLGTEILLGGFNYPEIETPIAIHSIEIDHICLQEMRGQAEFVTCIPYSNVAGLFYLNN